MESGTKGLSGTDTHARCVDRKVWWAVRGMSDRVRENTRHTDALSGRHFPFSSADHAFAPRMLVLQLTHSFTHKHLSTSHHRPRTVLSTRDDVLSLSQLCPHSP